MIYLSEITIYIQLIFLTVHFFLAKEILGTKVTLFEATELLLFQYYNIIYNLIETPIVPTPKMKPYLLTYLLIYLLTYLLTYLYTYIPTYLLT